MKMSAPTKEGTRQLFVWLQSYQPRVFAGLVRRFTPREQQLSGITDMLGSALTAASNFVSSQGFEKILTAAQPFIANKIEKQQLELQLSRIKNGLPPTAPAPVTSGAQASTGGPGGPGDPSRGQAPAPPAAEREIPWGWILGGTAAAVGLAMAFGGRRRA